MKEGHKAFCIKYQYFADLLEGQYFFEILQTLSTVKTSRTVVKSACFCKLPMERTFFVK